MEISFFSHEKAMESRAKARDTQGRRFSAPFPIPCEQNNPVSSEWNALCVAMEGRRHAMVRQKQAAKQVAKRVQKRVQKR